MKLEDVPLFSVVVIGHRANGHTATRRGDGEWHSNVTGYRIDLDPRDVTEVVFNAGE